MTTVFTVISVILFLTGVALDVMDLVMKVMARYGSMKTA